MNRSLVILTGAAVLCAAAGLAVLKNRTGAGAGEGAAAPAVPAAPAPAAGQLPPPREATLLSAHPGPAGPAVRPEGGLILSAGEMERLSGLQALMDSESDQTDAVIGSIHKWARAAPAACLAWCAAHLKETARLRAVEEAFATWLDAAPDEAMKWLAAHLPQPGNEGAVSHGIMHLADMNPQEAAAWVERNPDAGSLENWEIIVSRWSASDPAAIQSYLQSRLPEGLRHALLPALLAEAPRNTDLTSLLMNYPRNVQITALARAAESLAYPDPAAALLLAQAIPDKEISERLIEKIRHAPQEPDSSLGEESGSMPMKSLQPSPGSTLPADAE